MSGSTGPATALLICNTFIEGHLNFLQTIFLCCWNDSLPFLSPLFLLHSILDQQLLINGKHRCVVPIHGHVYRKLGVQSWSVRSLGRKRKKVQDCDHVFGSSTTFHRRKEWIFESRCQVSDPLHVFFALKPFRDYSLCSVCIFFPVCRPHSAFCTHPAFYSESAVCILPLVRSLQSAFHTDRNENRAWSQVTAK